MVKIKEQIALILSEILNKKVNENQIEKPKQDLGDYAFPCFNIAKELKKNPNEIAKELVIKVNETIKVNQKNIFEKIISTGPYVNFFISKRYLAESILKKLLEENTNNSYNNTNNNTKDSNQNVTNKNIRKTILIESPGPNTNKPLHLGHLRNMLLGNAIFNLYKYLGYITYRVDIVNDRGVHICKSMLAYQIYGNNQEPNKKSDHFVGDYYVKYSQESEKHPEYENLIKEMLVKWENQDTETIKLWTKMTDWALEGFKITYNRFNVKIDKAYYESEHYKKGKEIIEEGYKKGIFQKDEKGNIYVDLTKQGLGKKILLRADGTSIYITQDIALGKIRYDDYKMDTMVYVVGNEQIHHFKALFEIFKLLNYSFAEKCYHLAYGMIALPEGKMKSRQGSVVDADDLADDMHELAKSELVKRYPDLDNNELHERAEKIAMAAIKYFILKYDPMKDFVFNPKESLSFEGETGPYIQYTYARASSILNKSNLIKNKTDFLNFINEINYDLLTNNDDRILIMKLNDFNEIISKAAKEYSPAIICKYLFELSQIFNEYYHKNKIIQENKDLEKARLLLIKATQKILEKGLKIIGIDPLKEM